VKRCSTCGRTIGAVAHLCPTPRPLWDRFWEKVDASGDCWIWTAALNTYGYGKVGLGSKAAGVAPAHRVSWELLVGPIPDGFEVDHLCRVHACVNPAHLEPVPPLVNEMRDKGRKARHPANDPLRRDAHRYRMAEVAKYRNRPTHCKHGHPFDEQNTYTWRGQRHCRRCRYLAVKARDDAERLARHDDEQTSMGLVA
jgi:hypothetical protein